MLKSVLKEAKTLPLAAVVQGQAATSRILIRSPEEVQQVPFSHGGVGRGRLGSPRVARAPAPGTSALFPGSDLVEPLTRARIRLGMVRSIDRSPLGT